MAQATAVIGDIRVHVVDGGTDGEKFFHVLELYDVTDDAEFALYTHEYSCGSYDECQDMALTAFAAFIVSDNYDGLPKNMQSALDDLYATAAKQWLPERTVKAEAA